MKWNPRQWSVWDETLTNVSSKKLYFPMLQNFVLLVSGSFKYLMCSERLLLCRCTQQFSCLYFTDRLRPCALEFSIELSLIPHTFDPQLIHIRPWCLVSEPTLTITEQWSWVLFCYRRKGVTPCAVMLLIPILLLCQIMLILKKKTEVERSQVILGQTTEQHVTQ